MESNQAQAAASRLADKLSALDLDHDEQAVLVGILDAGAASIEPVGDEVQGFAMPGAFSFRKQGGFGLPMADESPKEEITFEYGGLQICYQQQ
jgi:hypothetical protein